MDDTNDEDDMEEVDRDDDLLDNWNAKQVRGMVDTVSSRPCSFMVWGKSECW